MSSGIGIAMTAVDRFCCVLGKYLTFQLLQHITGRKILALVCLGSF